MQIEKENGHTHIYLNREALSPLIAFIPNLQPAMEGIPNFGPMLYNSYIGPLYDNWSIITQLDLGLDLTDKNEWDFPPEKNINYRNNEETIYSDIIHLPCRIRD